MEETWKQVVDFDGYMVSSLGRVKSLERVITRINHKGTPVKQVVKEHILKPYITRGYYAVMLSMRKHKKVHRLVAEAFISNPSNKSEVNHKDGNKLNNTLENLEWCTLQENHKHSAAHGLKARGEKNGNSRAYKLSKLVQPSSSR